MPEMSPLDTYEIYETLGAGGGGTVIKAFHKRLQKYVVIKKIHSDIQDEAERRIEVDILKNLHHPYLPQVFDYFEVDGTVYVVMDYVQGESFGQKLARGERFNERKVLKYAKQVCEALDYLHSQRFPVIHGDIKPDNIMLTPNDDVCLIDFNISGIAKAGHAATVGYTEGYGAPEQYREFQRISALMASGTYSNNATEYGAGRTEILSPSGENGRTEFLGSSTGAGRTEILGASAGAGRTEILGSQPQPQAQFQPQPAMVIPIDKRSDIYSLGATLYHMYTGQMLNRNEANQISGKTSEGFLYILNKALQENPDNRYQDAGQMLDAINHLYKRDRRYRSMKIRHALAYVLLVGVCLTGVYFVLHGKDVYKEELLAEYDDYIEELTDARIKENDRVFDDIFEKASEFMPERLEAYYQKALYLYETKQYEETIKFVTKTLDGNGALYQQAGIGDMYYIMGTAYFELEDYENASNAFANAVKYNDENPIYYVDEAIALARTGRTGTAKEILEKAEKRGALSGNIYLVKGEIKLADEDYEGAKEELKRSIEEAEDDYTRMRAYVMCSKAILGQGASAGAIDEGIELLGEALNVLPNEYLAMVLEQLTNMYMEGYKMTVDRVYAEGALDTLEKICKAGWASFTTYDNMVNIYYQIGEYVTGVQLLTELTQEYPDNYKVPMKLAFFEVALQAQKQQKERNYSLFADYYKSAQELYSAVKRDGWSDPEMQVLENAYQELSDGHWLN